MLENAYFLALGFLGVLLHNLVELNKLNKASEGKLNLRNYLMMERFSICISFLVVVVSVMIKHEIVQLEAAGKWLGLAFISIGYMGQSLLIFVMGKASNKIGKNED